MTSAVNAFKAKMSIFSAHLQRNKLLNFTSVQLVRNDKVSESGALEKAAEKYSQVINRLEQDFESMIFYFNQLLPCVSFISNSFSQVDITCIAEQLSTTFNLDDGQVEI